MGDSSYFAHLQRRSRLGLLYRTSFLYPKLCRHLRGRALDVGCGIGDMLRHRPNTVGTDINPDAVNWCRTHGLDAVLMNVDQLPFESAEFDSAILDNVLEHLVEPRPLLAEIHRVIKPGGQFLVGVPGARGYTADPDHKHFYDPEALVERVTLAGFETCGVFHTPLPSRWLELRLRSYCFYGVFVRV